MPLPKVPKKILPKLTSVFLLLYVAATLPLLTNRLTSFAYIVQAVVQKKQNAESEATQSWRQAIQPNFWDAYLYYFLGLQLSSQGKVDEAIAAYRQAIRLYPEDDSYYQELGKALATQRKFDEEIATYRQAIKVNPHWTWAYNKLGLNFYFTWKGREALAVGLRNAPSAAYRAEAYSAKASAIAYRDAAIGTYRQAIQTNPNYAEGYNKLGNILQEVGRLDEAIATYQKAIQLNPKNDIAYTNIGMSFYDMGKLDEAIVAYRQAIQLNPKNAAPHHYLAWTLQQQGKLQQAIEVYKMASALPEFKSDIFFLKETERLSTLWKNPQLLAISERLPSLKDGHLVSLKRSVVRVIVKSSGEWKSGTGWVVKRQGNKAWVVTNRHVAMTTKNLPQLDPNELKIIVGYDINGPLSDRSIEVEFYSEPQSGEFRKRLPAKIAKITDPSNKLDLALLEVTDIPRDIKPLARSSVSVALKAPIRIIGHPNTADNWTVATGEVIKKTDQQLKLSAILAPGNSGSPVLDRQNRVVGVAWGALNQKPDGSGSAVAFPIESVTTQLKSWGID